MTSYAEKAKRHLSRYRTTRLGVRERGRPKGKAQEYGHIVPETLRQLNIIEGYRAEISEWLRSQRSGIKLHDGFHHLNSSQAACLNLFWPMLNSDQPSLIAESLGLGPTKVSCWEFEKVENSAEGTNFDLYLELVPDRRVYLEFKYTECEFSAGVKNSRRRQKFLEIYAPALEDKVAPKFLELEVFLRNYQILRNLAYFRPEQGDYVVFVIPRENTKLSSVSHVLDDAMQDPSIRSQVKIRHLEDVLLAATKACKASDHLLQAHLLMYKEKYLDLHALE